MLNKLHFLFVLLLFVGVFGQQKADSLQKEIARYEQIQHEMKITKPSLADSVKAKLLLKLGKEFTDSDPRKALYLINQSLRLSEQINFPQGIGAGYNGLALVYNSKSDFKLAIAACNKAVPINQKLRNPENLGYSYALLGQAYLYLNDFTFSLKYLNDAYRIFEKLQKHRRMAALCNDLAILYSKLPQADKQLAYYNKGLKILEIENAPQNEDLRFIIKGNIANFYSDQKQFTKANAILTDCIAYNEKHNLWSNAAFVYQQLGSNYGNMHQYDKALAFMHKALTNFIKTSNKSGEADAYRKIGEVYFLSGKMALAENFTQKGLQLSTQIGELESMKFAYENLSKIYAKKGNFKLAYLNHLQYKKVSDSMFNSEINAKLTQIQLTNEFEKKEEILRKQQQKREELHEIEANKQKKFKYIVLISMFLLSIVTASIYRNLKNYQKQRNIIQRQKEQIEASLQEKETLLREIHHRVKNNLQIISSLLNMQSDHINDKAVLDMIQEAQSRVQTMSLLHQNLYQSEEINEVDVENYIKRLVAYITQLFEGHASKVKTNVLVDGIYFDFDTAISLGLIVNELVTNAYKYAFNQQADGLITIQIRPLNTVDYVLTVSDNGPGLPSGFKTENTQSLGLKLVGILSRQLRGKFTVNTTESHTDFIVTFKDMKAYHAGL